MKIFSLIAIALIVIFGLKAIGGGNSYQIPSSPWTVPSGGGTGGGFGTSRTW